MGKSHPRVEARVLPGAGAPDPDAPPLDEALDRLHEFLTTVIDGIGLDVEIDVSQDGEALVADVVGEDLGILIGRHGQTLDALQYLSAIVVNGHSRSRRQVIVDAEGYRGRREVSLKGVADRAAQKAERTRNDGDAQADDGLRAQDRPRLPQGQPPRRDPLRGRRAPAFGGRLTAAPLSPGTAPPTDVVRFPAASPSLAMGTRSSGGPGTAAVPWSGHGTLERSLSCAGTSPS